MNINHTVAHTSCGWQHQFWSVRRQ